MHALRNFLFVANERQIRKRNHEDQLNQAACLNLVVNAVAVWNTVYLQAVLEQLRNEGYEIDEDDTKTSFAGSQRTHQYTTENTISILRKDLREKDCEN